MILLMCSFLQSFNTLPWRSAHSELLAFIAVLTWCWSAAYCNSVVRIRPNLPIIILFFTSLLIVIQYATGQIQFGGDAAILLIYVHLCIAVLLVAQWHEGDLVWPAVLAMALLITALASVFIALVQALGVWTNSDWIVHYPGFRRPGANMGQANHLGTLLVMAAASLIYLNQCLLISQFVTIFLSFFLLLGIGITESRTGLLSGIILCLWWLGRSQVFLRPPRWSWIATSVLTLIVMVLAWPPLISAIQEAGPLKEMVTINTNTSMRLEVWQQLWEAALMKPWLGWGLRGVPAALNAVLDHYSNSRPFTYAHNIILDLVIGIGFPLTILFFCVVSAWAWHRSKNVRTIESWYAIGLLIPFTIHSLFEYPFAYSYFLVPAMLSAGILEWGNNYNIKAAIPRNIIFGFIIAFTFALARISLEYINVEEDFRVARFEALNVGRTPADYKRPSIFVLTQLEAMATATRTMPEPNMSDEEIDLLRMTASRFPWIPIQNIYTLSLALNGHSQEAIRQLKVIRIMHGERAYKECKSNWAELSNSKYPQLQAVILP